MGIYKRYGRKRRRHPALTLFLWVLAALVLVFLLRRFLPRKYYTAQQLGIPELHSAVDYDGDGLDDYADIMRGARDYIATKPHYGSRYYAGGYPDDGLGVCTDVIWQAFRAAGYELKDLVDADITAHRDAYPFIEYQDSNIDFRRVNTLNTFFSRHATPLTVSFDHPEEWQAGDIVIFGQCSHIAICSDKRDKNGIPWIIHHGNPIDDAVERMDIYQQEVTHHYRWGPVF